MAMLLLFIPALIMSPGQLCSVEIADNTSERAYFIDLLFVYENEEERKVFEAQKLPEQIVEIMRPVE
ncbi:MAG: hypothetical protein QM731_20710 [Chitinophagaceae bacterium]